MAISVTFVETKGILLYARNNQIRSSDW